METGNFHHIIASSAGHGLCLDMKRLATRANDFSHLVIPSRVIRPKSIQSADRLFAVQPIRLTDQFGNSDQLAGASRKIEKPLPEFLFVGSTNVGKSSLMTALLCPPSSIKGSKQKPRDYPWKSKARGFTRTLSVYTVGNQLRLLDSPGYGFRSTNQQGNLIAEYLNSSHSSNLMRTFLLVKPRVVLDGLHELDLALVKFLAQYGISFDLVITKSDTLKRQVTESDYDKISSHIEGALGNCVPFDMYITSSTTGEGIRCLRGAIYEASGLIESGMK